MDEPEHMDVSDGDKGARSSFETSFAHATHLLDYFHRVQALSKSKGTAAAQAYKELCACRCPAELRSLTIFGPAVLSAINAVPDCKQFPIATPGTRGQRGSSACESLNNAMKSVRQASFVSSLMKLVTNIKKRYDTQRKATMEFPGPLPPRVRSKMADAFELASRITSGHVAVSTCGTCADVQSVRYAGLVRRVIFNKIKNCNDLSCSTFCSTMSPPDCGSHAHGSKYRISDGLQRFHRMLEADVQ